MSSTETVTILFTDLVGSTSLASTVGPVAAEELRQEHFGLLRAPLEQAGGREVKNLGDGLMAAFVSASNAVECAVEMQQRLEQRNRRGEQQLSVRIGVALGEAEREGDDYFGLPVVEASRLCAKAVGGQVVCSDLVRVMAERRIAQPFRALGALDLKGVPEPVPAFEVAWEPVAAATTIPLPPRLRAVPSLAYVGRERERALLERRFDLAWRRRRRVTLIAGEPGIGKTRLATYAALQAHARGAAVLYGRCDEDLAVPYQPWVEALGDFVDVAPLEELEAHVERHGGELTRLVPGLARRVADVPSPRESDPETERYSLYGAVVGLLAECSNERPLVLVLDDLHWADGQTLSLLKHVAASGAQLGALVIATYRDCDVARGHPLVQAVADLRREEGVERISLEGLEEHDVVAMIEGAAGHELTADGLQLAQAVRRETNGNPFFVAEIMRHLLETGGVVRREDGRWLVSRSIADLGLPESVREVIGRRVDRLGEATRRVLSIASVMGRDFGFDLLSTVTELGEEALLDLLDEAVEAAVLVESATPGRFTFAHALVNHTLYEELGTTRRARLHRRVAEAIEELCGDDLGPRLGELARHWAAAASPVDPGKAIHYAGRAGDRALAQLAPDEALRWFGQALELLDGQPTPDAALRCDLLTGLGDARRQTGDPAFRETLLEASRLALDHGDDDRLVRAVLTNNRGTTSGYGRVDRERVAFLEAALARIADGRMAQRARLRSLLALELIFGSDYAHRRALSDEALELARRTGDDRVLAQVLLDRAYAIWGPGSLSEREAGVAELLEVAQRLGDPVTRFWALYNAVDVCMEQADVERARRHVRECRALAEELRQPTLQWAALSHEACLALAIDTLDAAEALAVRALQVGQASGQPDALIAFAAQWGLVLIERARWDECIPPGEKAAQGFPGLPAFHASLGIQYLDAGRPDDARRVIEEARARGLRSVWGTPITTAALALYAETAARLGDRRAAAELYELVAPITETLVWNNGTNTFNAMAYYKGALAAALGRYQEAETRFAEAIEQNLRIGAARWCIRPRLAWGEMLRERACPGDLERAQQLCEQALQGAREFGCPALAERAEAGMVAAAAAT